MAVGYFTDVVLHSSKNYHHERATNLRRLSKKDSAVDGAVNVRFHGDSNLQVVIRGIFELEQRKMYCE
jgi:hypothetical protein